MTRTRTRRARFGTGRMVLACAAVALVVIGARHTHPTTPPTTAPTTGANTPTPAAALRQLDALPVLLSRPHHAGYERGCGHEQACRFGPAWTDATTAPGGHNGCDTRNDILRSQLTHVTFRAGSRCVVVAGVLRDPYTGHTIAFSKAHAAAVQIDHLVPLALAWDLGAYAWPLATREAYANDERLVLLAVSGPSNEAKADNGPAGWMPPDRSYRATYAARFVAVLSTYHLPVTAADKSAVTAALKGH